MKSKQENMITEDEIILNSLGILGEEEKKLFKSKLKSAENKEKKAAKDYNNLTSLISIVAFSDKLIAPSASVKEKLFQRLETNNNSEKQNVVKNFEFVFSSPEGWTDHPEIKGIKVKPLALNPDKEYLMILMKAEAGAEYPSHHHSGAEECYVIKGDLFVEGKYLGPGDFHHAEGGSDHEPLRTKNGCTLLLVVDPKDY